MLSPYGKQVVNTGSLENDTVERKKILQADTERQGFCFVLCVVEKFWN